MRQAVQRFDLAIWVHIIACTGLIYSTLSIVTVIRKTIEERFGRGVYNIIYEDLPDYH